MSEIIPFKPRQPLELPHYHSIICELAALTPQDRLSVIAAACDDADWQELFELEVYSLIAAHGQKQKPDPDTIRQLLHRLIEKVISQATGGSA